MCEHEHHQHHHSHKSNTLFKVLIAGVIFITAMLLNLSGVLKFAVYFIAYIIAGGDVLLKAFKNIIKGEVFDENFLMGLATLGAFAIKEYPEAVMVMILYQIGEYLQHRAVEKSRNSIAKLMDIRPDYANIEENGKIVQKSPELININDDIIVKTGEKIPLDGIVIEGNASVDTSALTGESIPKEIKVNDIAVSGCININGLLKIKVTKKFTESTVSKILELVENAGARKTRTENFITRFARYYTPVVVIGAVLLALVPPLIIGAQFSVWLERALTFLVISCPCALVISVPLGFFAGIGGASRCGILIKGSNYLEALSKADTFVFDKTGTLTKGVFKVTEIEPVKGITTEELLELTALAENYSNHPIALSIKKAYGKEIDSALIQDVTEIAGNGVKAKIKGNTIFAGNNKLMENFNVNYEKSEKTGTVIYTAKNNKYIGRITISDEIKPDSKSVVETLNKSGYNTVMLTGDNKSTADFTAKELGINTVYSQLMPADKVEKIEDIITKKHKNKSVIFAGDGINDAPVLTRADVGIAMGALGSDAAIEAADVVIMDDKPSKILSAVKISKKTMSIVKQNIVFAIGIKVLFLILGAAGFITMWGAVFADVGVTLLAVLNSLRALHLKCSD
ncbi:MAG: heavy metal translocating P-type ATPase [Candidatus Gastranaerophilaceae bacterium]